MIEEWRDVPGCPGYQVSNLGRIRGRSGRIIGGTADASGYLRISVRDGARYRSVSVHSMVALAFLGPRPEGHEIDHINRARDHNAPHNLRYVTHAENMAVSVQPFKGKARNFTGLQGWLPHRPGCFSLPARAPTRGGFSGQRGEVRGSKNGRSRLTASQVAEIRNLERPGKRGPKGQRHPNSAQAIAERYGVSVGAIKDILAGRNWSSSAPNHPNASTSQQPDQGGE